MLTDRGMRMDDYYEGLCDVLNQALKEATRQRDAQRREIAALRQELRERDPDLWALAEENQSLRMRLTSMGVPCE